MRELVFHQINLCHPQSQMLLDLVYCQKVHQLVRVHRKVPAQGYPQKTQSKEQVRLHQKQKKWERQILWVRQMQLAMGHQMQWLVLVLNRIDLQMESQMLMSSLERRMSTWEPHQMLVLVPVQTVHRPLG